MVKTHNLGFPRIGAKRELKFALESYWSGQTSRSELKELGARLRLRHWAAQGDLDLAPVGDFAFYDHVLDTSFMVGNLKFDVTPSAENIALGQGWRAEIGHRPVWLAASTRQGEEHLILEAWRRIGLQNALLVMVPRHPQRFDEVAELLKQQGLNTLRRSAGMPSAATQVWLGDSMGEMAAYYTLADLAFIGGSLLPLGGQNLIEAAACRCPVLVGPHTFNFLQATEDAITAGAARRIETPPALAAAVESLLGNAAELTAMQTAARRFAQAHQGATQRMLALIARWSGQAGC